MSREPSARLGRDDETGDKNLYGVLFLSHLTAPQHEKRRAL